MHDLLMAPLMFFLHLIYFWWIGWVVILYYLWYSAYWYLALLWVSVYMFWYLDGSQRGVGKYWPAFANLGIWDIYLNYFPMTLHTVPLEKGKKYIIAVQPHGVVSVNHVLLMARRDRYFPDHPKRDMIASVLFRIPFLREFHLWLGCTDASKRTAQKILRHNMSLLLYPGGEQEQMRSRIDEFGLYLKHRLGFIRLAMEEGGIEIVPILAFGETRIFEQAPILLSFRLWLVKKFQMGIPFLYGRWGTIIPRKVPLHLVMAPPFKVPAFKHPPKDAVHACLNDYIAHVTDFYEKEKGKYDYDGVPLVIH